MWRRERHSHCYRLSSLQQAPQQPRSMQLFRRFGGCCVLRSSAVRLRQRDLLSSPVSPYPPPSCRPNSSQVVSGAVELLVHACGGQDRDIRLAAQENLHKLVKVQLES